MRARRLRLGVLLIVTVGAILWFARSRQAIQTVVLPDGSRFTLLKVTSGTNHTCRFDHRWQDFLYPVLPPNLRVRLSARVIEWNSLNRDSVMVWFRRDGLPSAGVEATRIYLSAADDHGLESPLQQMADTTRTRGSLKTATNTTGTQFSGWELMGFPKRSRHFNIVVRCPTSTELTRAGEFRIPNPARRRFPVWTAEALPATRKTNGLEVTLTKLETGMSGAMSGAGPKVPARVFSRAIFQFGEKATTTEAWAASSSSWCAGKMSFASWKPTWPRTSSRRSTPKPRW